MTSENSAVQETEEVPTAETLAPRGTSGEGSLASEIPDSGTESVAKAPDSVSSPGGADVPKSTGSQSADASAGQTTVLGQSPANPSSGSASIASQINGDPFREPCAYSVELDLTDAERASLGDGLADLYEKVEALELEKKAATANLKWQIDGLKTKIKKTAKAIARKREFREVKAERVYDGNIGLVWTEYAGKRYEERPMKTAEYKKGMAPMFSEAEAPGPVKIADVGMPQSQDANLVASTDGKVTTIRGRTRKADKDPLPKTERYEVDQDIAAVMRDEKSVKNKKDHVSGAN